IGLASAPGCVIESVDAPWRTVTPGQSTSAAVFADSLLSEDVEPLPNSQPPSLSVMDWASAGALANSRMPSAAPPANFLADNSIPHLVSGRVIAAAPWRPQGNRITTGRC